jgi:hypothetical protein
MEGFDRYAKFREGNTIGIVPFGEVPKRDSDIYIIFEKGKMRLDQLSYKYYGSSSYAWFIMQANAKYGSLEFRIPDGAELRIPFPLDAALAGYQKSLDNNKKFYN